MLPNESVWFREKLIQYIYKDGRVLNIGSSTRHFREVAQPYIYGNVLLPLSKIGVEVVHVDLRPDNGVDLVGDVTDPTFLEQLKRLFPIAVICSNLLEHLIERQTFCVSISALLPPGGLIFSSCPYAYPYHADPIDTMFRPNVNQLAAEFPDTTLLEGDIVDCGTWREKIAADRERNPQQWKRQRRNEVIKRMLPLYQPRDWWRNVTGQDRFPLERHISATCVVLRKE